MKKKRIFLILLLVCIGIIIYNGFLLIRWYHDSQSIIKETGDLEKIIKVIEIEDPENVEIINHSNDKLSDYWYYINLPLTRVDLTDLKKINNNTVGYLSVAGTNINYPVVQTSNNDYYLNHSFQNDYNRAGWVFMDYRNDAYFNNKNTIIYAHSRIDETMFGSLKNILKSSWINNKDNYVIRYSSETDNMLFQIFSVYTIPVESYYIQTDFINEDDYKIWLDAMLKRSHHDFKVTLNEKDKIITLSTCKGNDRVVLHAKLIKKGL